MPGASPSSLSKGITVKTHRGAKCCQAAMEILTALVISDAAKLGNTT